jgi:hypothetical protein
LFALLAFALAAPGVAEGLSTTGTRRLITVIPRIGIGPVKLGERHRSVDQSLGKGRLQHGGTYDGYYRYRSGSIAVEVSYDPTGHVNGVNTTSGAALIFGHRLSQGLAGLKPIFRAHHWMILSCQGETFTFLEPGGPGTGIAWRAGRLDDVQIDAGGSIGEACLPI